ncbi:MAG: site-specific integrase [Oscillospiraceae bacterium]|nr:site-specific integrase [Oscillospiraceae bacterium]
MYQNYQKGEIITYRAWLSIWLPTKGEYIRESTLANYQQAVSKHILPALGDLSLAELTEQKVQETVLFWLKEGRCDGQGGLSERTVRGMVTFIKLSLKSAAKAGYISRKDFDILFPTQNPTEQVQTFSKQEQAILTQYIYLHLTPKNLGILLCMHTGLRIGELCALQWKDIHLESRTITVSKTLQRIFLQDTSGKPSTKITITPPKTRHSVRVIPISSLLYPVLKHVQPKNPEIYLLTGKTSWTEPRTYRDYYNRLLKKLEIPHVNFHGLRHTFATRLIENGADYKTVSELLGHASVTITMNLYVHSQMEQKRKAVELLNFYF